jgi:hypothetical protein
MQQLWRARAQRTRDLIPFMTNPTTKENMQKMADDYEIAARQMDERVARPEAMPSTR